MKMTHKHDVYFSPHSTEAHSLVMQIADYCNKRGIWYKISESTLGIGIVYGGNVGYVIDADRKTENCSEKPNNCEYAENPSGDVWECGCFLDTYCEHQIYDRNPDGTINIVECGYEPKDEPQTDCDGCQHYADEYTADACYECKRSYADGYEPQTERSE